MVNFFLKKQKPTRHPANGIFPIKKDSFVPPPHHHQYGRANTRIRTSHTLLLDNYTGVHVLGQQAQRIIVKDMRLSDNGRTIE